MNICDLELPIAMFICMYVCGNMCACVCKSHIYIVTIIPVKVHQNVISPIANYRDN